MKRKIWWLAFLASFLTVFLYPFETLVVPEWKAKIVDEGSNPLARVRVTEHWQHYSIETQGHEADAWADQLGDVAFPQRTIRASLFRRLFGAIRNIVRTGIHASFGPSAYLIVLTDFEHSTENADYSPGKPPAQTIVLRRLP
jgi:hypothetical protein